MNKLDEQLRDKANNIKYELEEYKNKIYEYEQEIKRNAKHIGEMEADLTNKKDQIYRMENNVRQLE